MHIVILIPNTDENLGKNLRIGGAEKQILRLLPTYANHKEIKIDLITKYTKYIPHSNNIIIHQLSSNSILFVIQTFFRLFSINKKQEITILNPHILGITIIPCIFFKMFVKTQIMTKISGEIYQLINTRTKNHLIKALDKIFVKFLIENSNHFQALNNRIKEDLQRNYNVPTEKIHLIPNAINLDDFKYIKKMKKITRFGYVGRLEKVKNIFLMLEAFEIVLQKNCEITLQLYGLGTLYNQIDSYIKSKQLENVIKLKGFQTNAHEIYSSFDCFILPSESEGLSNSLLEAMALGIPVIVSNIAGNMQLIKNHRNGLVFQVDSVKNLSNNMEKYINDQNFAEKMRESARNDIELNYSSKEVIKKLLIIYKRIQ
ncbi:UDP-N-acetylglucosamine--peptide N-acetylglucosaminyltransferase GtfA subunit [Candidatus Lokiarchaeum ossiferum]|uniref:UDP-N-acetylglucosamine--peptide N-acetylglucosaminyltransferase GtfA subunit n=1 Tax=Candidatus Lokiarchaeum ossiferum TaxID=2951803 RepID=A0ABY6HX80_9ARCH|nr:UDP-N-acetylglucosamine--peptide N-acetylglucosaminyltransferase GtfA subunit [Candidatus Lokiarchaeum sp. B-35]